MPKRGSIADRYIETDACSFDSYRKWNCLVVGGKMEARKLTAQMIQIF